MPPRLFFEPPVDSNSDMKSATARRPASLALLTACGLAGCASAANPTTGILTPRVSEAQEIRAGQRAAREASRTLGLVANQELQDYVQRVGARLAAESDRAQLAWTFRVVDDAMPNAFGIGSSTTRNVHGS